MTTQESFKRRVRARMAQTGERYTTARNGLIRRAAAEPEPEASGRRWVSQPELGNDSLVAATGRGWDEWCDILDDWPGEATDHGGMVAHLQHDHDVSGWWAQTITVGYERITGLRLPHQMPDGTFTASRTSTITVDATALRELLLDEQGRAALFPGMDPELRSRPASRSLRVGFEVGTAEFSIEPRDDGRATVTVSHHRLPSFDDVAVWKEFWADWLGALDEG